MTVYVCRNEWNDTKNAVFATENKALAWVRDQLIEDLDPDDPEYGIEIGAIMTADDNTIIEFGADEGYYYEEHWVELENEPVAEPTPCRCCHEEPKKPARKYQTI